MGMFINTNCALCLEDDCDGHSEEAWRVNREYVQARAEKHMEDLRSGKVKPVESSTKSLEHIVKRLYRSE